MALRLTMAFSDNPRVQPLKDGAVKPQGIDFNCGVSRGVLLVFDWRVVELVRLGSEQMGWKWLGDRHGGNLGTDLFGEKDTLLDGLGREVRPIGRYQDVLEQFGSPPVSVSF